MSGRDNGRRRGRSSDIVRGGLGLINGGQSSSSPDLDSDPAAAPTKYEEDVFLVASRHSGGDMKRVDFRANERHIAWAEAIAESRKFPTIKSKSDIFRLGLAIVLPWLESLAPGIVERSVMHQIEQMQTVVAWEMRNLRYVKFIDSIQAMITEQLALPNGRKQVARVLRRLRRHFNAMEPSFYKAHVEKMFDDRFGPLQLGGLVLLDADGEDSGLDDADTEQTHIRLLTEIEMMLPEPDMLDNNE